MLATDPALLTTLRPGNRSRDSCDPIGVISPDKARAKGGGTGLTVSDASAL